MLTTPIVARFHSSAPSSSATETLKLVRSRSFRLRTTCRLSLIDCAASMWSSRVRKAIKGSFEYPVSSFPFRRKEMEGNQKPETVLSDHFRGDALGHERFDDVPGLDVAVVRDRDAALHAVGDFLGIVFEAAQ